MARGRPKTNPQLNDLHGNPGKRKPKKSATLPKSTGKLGLPRGLSDTTRRKCSEMAAYLRDAGIPISFCRPMFERYCKHLQLAETAWRDFNRKGATDAQKKVAIKNYRDGNDMAVKIEKRFIDIIKDSGGVDEVPEKNPLQEFMDNGKKLGVVK